MVQVADRAVVFIDGNNWYHSLREAGVTDLGRLDYARISAKLLGPRLWVATRYYIGRLSQAGNPELYANQRSFLASLEATDGRISVHLGRIETRPFQDPAALELRQYLATLTTRIDGHVFHDLMAIAAKHADETVLVEKAVDVMLAVDMVTMAVSDSYDAAYLLSADGDLTPAVSDARTRAKKVYVASPGSGAQLAAVANAFITLEPDWFSDCYKV
jgi:uncharacterized LabA/DUF88 family protein